VRFDGRQRRIRVVTISLESRRVGDITVVTCTGRIVEGTESIALQQLLDDLLQDGPDLILHVGGVDFIDSSGLGLLVRYATRTRNAGGNLKLCVLLPKIAEVLKVTHLGRILEWYETEAGAITAFYQHAGWGAGSSRLQTDILCVDASANMQAYVRELLGQAGYGVLTAGNLPDALILVQATQPKVVIIDADLRRSRGTQAAEKFNRLADALAVIELPADFSARDAGEAAERLLDQIRALALISLPAAKPALDE
jgi:anti-sigma B factor antagonist